MVIIAAGKKNPLLYAVFIPSKYIALIGPFIRDGKEYTNNAQGIYFRLDLCPFQPIEIVGPITELYLPGFNNIKPRVLMPRLFWV